ncbi:hypothetical protein AA18889_0184 [Acetobacter senegalensis DSM 18889]|nr:hypothetical protein AA18889_0184 [Acetobacter senegalensis DSM 18889]
MVHAPPPNQPEQYVFSHVEDKAILRIIRRTLDHFQIKETPQRNKVFSLTQKLLHACHSRACTLDLEGMVSAQDFQLVLDDLTTLRKHLDTNRGYLPHGTRMNFALNMAYKKDLAHSHSAHDARNAISIPRVQ